MNVVEFFAGSRSVGKVAASLGMNVFSTDIYGFEDIDYAVDILEFDVGRIPFDVVDVAWFSPPCTAFSVAAIGTHWKGSKRNDYTPATDTARLGVQIVKKVLSIIDELKKKKGLKYWYIENPRGLLRRLDFMLGLYRTTVTYCQYGDTRMKPTDIWNDR